MSNYTGTIFINLEVESEEEASKLLFQLESYLNEALRRDDRASAQLADSFQDDETGEELDYCD